MHGWQDNAGSFDNLAPLIMQNVPVLAIDLPGHGLSSWLPPGLMYKESIYVLLIERIKRHFKWAKVKILGHSLSTMITYWYAACFPTHLQYVVALDFYKFPSVDTDDFIPIYADAMEAFLKIEEKSNAQPSYTESEIIQKWLGGYISLTNAECKLLMTRGTTRKDDGRYIFNRDPRLKVLPVHSMFSQEQLEEFAKLITCPYLILRGEESPYFADSKEAYHTSLKVFQDCNKNVYYKEVPGKHHFHLTNADSAAAEIKPFLEKYD